MIDTKLNIWRHLRSFREQNVSIKWVVFSHWGAVPAYHGCPVDGSLSSYSGTPLRERAV